MHHTEIHDLPEEMVGKILSQFHDYRQLHTISQVSRLWFRLVWDQVRALYLRKFPSVLQESRLLFSLVQTPQIQTLHLPPDAVDRHLQMLEAAPTLEELYIRRCRSLTDEGTRSLASLSLRGLYMSTSWNLASLSFLQGSVDTLEYLELRGCDLINDEALIALEAACDRRFLRMRSLDLRDCNGITDLGISILVLLMPNLRLLDASGCNITADGLEAISSLPKLEELLLWGCPAIDDKAMGPLVAMPQLRTLNILDCDAVTDTGLRALHRSTTLQSIELGSQGLISLQGIAWLLLVPSLKSLSVMSRTLELALPQLLEIKEARNPALELHFVQLGG